MNSEDVVVFVTLLHSIAIFVFYTGVLDLWVTLLSTNFLIAMIIRLNQQNKAIFPLNLKLAQRVKSEPSLLLGINLIPTLMIFLRTQGKFSIPLFSSILISNLSIFTKISNSKIISSFSFIQLIILIFSQKQTVFESPKILFCTLIIQKTFKSCFENFEKSFTFCEANIISQIISIFSFLSLNSLSLGLIDALTLISILLILSFLMLISIFLLYMAI